MITEKNHLNFNQNESGKQFEANWMTFKTIIIKTFDECSVCKWFLSKEFKNMNRSCWHNLTILDHVSLSDYFEQNLFQGRKNIFFKLLSKTKQNKQKIGKRHVLYDKNLVLALKLIKYLKKIQWKFCLKFLKDAILQPFIWEILKS